MIILLKARNNGRLQSKKCKSLKKKVLLEAELIISSDDLDEEYEHSAPKGEQFRAFFGEVQEQVEVNNTKAHDAGHDRQQMLFMNGLNAITGSRGLIGAAN